MAVLCLIVPATSACGVKSHAWVQDVGARQLRITDRQEPMTKVQAAVGSGYYLDPERDNASEPYGQSKPYLLVDVGSLNPIFAMSNKDDGNTETKDDLAGIDHPDAPFGKGEWALQFSLPVAFHLWWDAFADNNPILNTDYTFGGDVALRWSRGDAGELRVGGHWGHISTHLGDEYVIAASNDGAGHPFDRVNVSYWPIRGRLGWTVSNNLFGQFDNLNKWLLSITGEIERTNRSSNEFYYSLFPKEADPARVPLVKTRTEGAATLDFRYYFGNGIGSTSGDVTVASHMRAAVTVAKRAVFPYHNDLNEADNRWSIDAVAGYTFPSRLKLGARQAMTFVRYYHGPNPYGQFRNQTSFSHFGLGLALVH